MRIQSTTNGGFADVTDDYAERLIAAGGWKRHRKPRTTKPKPAPEKEPSTKE